MATGSQQLLDDYEQLQSSLELFPKIVIVKTEGNPPDTYEIEYSVRGFAKEADGSIGISETHRVQITLPFGYPHFAPTVKPLSDIFHPDVDPAAFKIADKWQENPSLSDLVLHIGEMICGTVFKSEDPFNQEAADWYAQNQSQLPLDTLSIIDMEPADKDIDDLVDDTFASLGLETDKFLEPEKPFDQETVAAINDLISQKKIFAANETLSELPETADFTERDELQENINKKLKKTEQLFQLAEQLEDLGKIDEAIEVVDNLFDIAIDIPGSDSLRTRIKNAYSLVASLKKDRSHTEKSTRETAEQKPDAKKISAKPSSPSKFPKPSLPQVQFKIPIKLIFISAVTMAICLGAISLYFKDQNILSYTQAELLKAQLLIDKKQFDKAEDALLDAQKDLGKLTILRFKKSSLSTEIDTILSSKELTEGLKGHILYDGRYMPFKQANALRELTVLTSQAKQLRDQNSPAEALTLYRQAQQFAQANDLKEQVADLEQNIKSLELQQTLALAEKAELGKDWQEAAETYRQALELSSSLSDPRTASIITSRLTAATFRHELDLSKETFTQEHWQETIAKLEKAQQLVDENPKAISPKELKDLHRLLVNARLYSTLSAARSATNLKDWDKAIQEYTSALNLLSTEEENFKGFLDDSIHKIERTLFMVRIAKMRESVLLADSKQNLQESIDESKKIIRFIANSAFKDDPGVARVQERLQESIKEKEEQVILNRRISWLKEHYEEIFRANYPTFRGSKLVNPDAALLKKVDTKSVFILTCTEKSHGSSTRLELNYMYDSATDTWSVYTAEE